MAHPLGGPPLRRQPKPRSPNPTTPRDLPVDLLRRAVQDARRRRVRDRRMGRAVRAMTGSTRAWATSCPSSSSKSTTPLSTESCNPHRKRRKTWGSSLAAVREASPELFFGAHRFVSSLELHGVGSRVPVVDHFDAPSLIAAPSHQRDRRPTGMTTTPAPCPRTASSAADAPP